MNPHIVLKNPSLECDLQTGAQGPNHDRDYRTLPITEAQFCRANALSSLERSLTIWCAHECMKGKRKPYSSNPQIETTINLCGNRQIAVLCKEYSDIRASKLGKELAGTPVAKRPIPELSAEKVEAAVDRFISFVDNPKSSMSDLPQQSAELIEIAVLICERLLRDIEANAADSVSRHYKEVLESFHGLHSLICFRPKFKNEESDSLIDQSKFGGLDILLTVGMDQAEAFKYLRRSAARVAKLFLKSSFAKKIESSDILKLKNFSFTDSIPRDAGSAA